MGSEGDKYLLFLLLENLDLKEFSGSSSKEKNLPPKQKVDFFLQRLTHSIGLMSFLDYFASVMEQTAGLWHQTVFELANDMNKFLKMNHLQQIAVSLACFMSTNKKTIDDGARLLKKSLQEYHSMGKIQIFPDYLQHMLIYSIKLNPEFKVFIYFVSRI